jgi:hypothetical protein
MTDGFLIYLMLSTSLGFRLSWGKRDLKDVHGHSALLDLICSPDVVLERVLEEG